MEVPHLNALYDKYQQQGLVVLGINQEQNHSAVKDYAKNNINYPVLVYADKTYEDYRVQGIPCTYYIDKEGKINKREVGFGEGNEVAMEKLIVKLLNKEKLSRERQ